MKNTRSKALMTSVGSLAGFFLIFNSFGPAYFNTEALIVQSNPFWMPLEFDIGAGYFKTNVFVQGFKNDTGLAKVCVTAEATNRTLCHYMNPVEEEGQIISPYSSVHAGIFVFPSSQIPVNSTANVCITILRDQKTICENITNDPKTIEQMVDLKLNN